MVLVWGFLARGNDGHTLVMVAINSLTMLMLVKICLRSRTWFDGDHSRLPPES